MSKANVVHLRRAADLPRQIGCSMCGATTDVACDCGASYVPAGQRAAEAIAANPARSDRAIAAEIGIDHKTVGKARRSVGEHSPPEKRVGQDGKSYPATKIKPAPSAQEERDRNTCVALYLKATDAGRDRAQWLLDHPGYSDRAVEDRAAKPKTKMAPVEEPVDAGPYPDIDLVDLYVETDTIGAAATNNLITSISVFFEEHIEKSFTKWMKGNPTEDATDAVAHALVSYANGLVRRARKPFNDQRKAYNKLWKVYNKRFGGVNYLGDDTGEMMRLMQASLDAGVDQLVEMKAATKVERAAMIEQQDREHEEFLSNPIDAETEQNYTHMIRYRRLYEGACMLDWEMYFKYREEHPELDPLTALDLEYASMWTSCAVVPEVSAATA